MKRSFHLLSVLLFILVLVTVPSFVIGFAGFPLARADIGASSGESWAIIVGVSDYLYSDILFLPDLQYCDDNARDLYNLIAPSWGESHVKLLIDAETNKTDIHDAIFNWLAPVEDADDTVFFFFSGHGGNGSDVAPTDETDGLDEYICSHDSLTSSWANDIRDDELDAWLSILDSGKVVVVLDACFSGGFITSMGATKFEIDKTETTEDDTRLGSPNDGFAMDISKSGRAILTACAENEESWEVGVLQHSVFSHYIIEALSKLDTVDANSNHEISAEEIFNYAEPRTVSFTTENCTEIQQPQLYDGYAGEIPLLTTATITFITNPPRASITVDGATYSPSQQPKPFTWAISTIHTFNASSQAYEINEESPHPYPNYCNSTWYITRLTAVSMRVHFNYIRTEKNYDYVRVLDNAGNICANYTGNFTDMWSMWVPGNIIGIRLTSDFSQTYDGFLIDNLEYVDSLGKTAQEYARYTFNSWNDGITSSSRTLTVAEPQMYTATYNTEYYLTINSLYGSKGGEGWYENGTNAYANLTAGTVDHGNGTRRIFTHWSGDASGTNCFACDPICMNSSGTATANWKTQYRVSFATNPGDGGTVSPSSDTWIDQGASPISISSSAGFGYSFSSWSATTGINIANAQSRGTTATVTGPGTITAIFTANPVIPELPSALILTAFWTLVSAMAAAFRKRKVVPTVNH